MNTLSYSKVTTDSQLAAHIHKLTVFPRLYQLNLNTSPNDPPSYTNPTLPSNSTEHQLKIHSHPNTPPTPYIIAYFSPSSNQFITHIIHSSQIPQNTSHFILTSFHRYLPPTHFSRHRSFPIISNHSSTRTMHFFQIPQNTYSVLLPPAINSISLNITTSPTTLFLSFSPLLLFIFSIYLHPSFSLRKGKRGFHSAFRRRHTSEDGRVGYSSTIQSSTNRRWMRRRTIHLQRPNSRTAKGDQNKNPELQQLKSQKIAARLWLLALRNLIE